MQSLTAELLKVEGRTSTHAELADATVSGVIERLERMRREIEIGGPAQWAQLANALKTTGVKLSDSQKEWHACLSRLGKTIDKRFSADLTPLLPSSVPAEPIASTSSQQPSRMYFDSPSAVGALDEVVATHFVRQGLPELARTMQHEASVAFPEATEAEFLEMHAILRAMRDDQDLRAALAWTDQHREFLTARGSPLEFHLHRSQYVRLLLSDSIPIPPTLELPSLPKASPSTGQGQHLAYAYARTHFTPFFEQHGAEIQRLLTAALFLPIERLLRSPYADVFAATPGSHSTESAPVETDADVVMAEAAAKASVPPPSDPDDLHFTHLAPLLTAEYCALLKRSRDLPLKVATDIGGGGALARLAKVRTVMKDKRAEWTQAGELPVEIALPPAYRFHSVFSCPVSRSASNQPMMLSCGHVVGRESLLQLSKNGQHAVKCPYCPQSSSANQAMRLYF